MVKKKSNIYDFLVLDEDELSFVEVIIIIVFVIKCKVMVKFVIFVF